jgi:hypothetical protein
VTPRRVGAPFLTACWATANPPACVSPA